MDSQNVEINKGVPAGDADIKSLQSVSPSELKNTQSRRDFLIKLKNLSFAAIAASTFGTDNPYVGIARKAVSWITNSTPTKEETEQRLRVYVPESSVSVKGKPLQQIGVAHSSENYYAHKEDIETKVRNSSRFVFLEYFDDEIAQEALPDSSEPITLLTDYYNFNNSARTFFSGIGRIAAKEGKDIIVVNPQNLYSQIVDNFGVLSLTGAIIYEDFRALKNRATKDTPISRRDLLKLPLKVSARAVAYGIGVPRILEKTTGFDVAKRLQKVLRENGVITNDLSEEAQAEILKWYEKDWRDVCSSIGVEAAFNKYSNEVSSEESTPMFQGLAHSSMINYLTDKTLRDKKDLSYKPLNLGGNRQVRRYHYDQQANSWKLVDSFSY